MDETTRLGLVGAHTTLNCVETYFLGMYAVELLQMCLGTVFIFNAK